MNKKTMPRVWMTLFAVMMVCASLFLAPADAHAAAAPKKITLAAKKQTLSVGSKNFTLKVKKVNPAKASKKVTYKSSDPSVAAVNKNNGKVTAKKVGTAKITVTSKANKKVKAVCTITVVNGVTGIQTANKVTLQVKKKMTLSVGVVPATASKKMLYSTNKPSVAKVNKKVRQGVRYADGERPDRRAEGDGGSGQGSGQGGLLGVQQQRRGDGRR